MTRDFPLNRRSVLAAGAVPALAGFAPMAFAQENQSMRPSRLRHYVIAAKDLDAVCNEIYRVLDLEPLPKEGPDPTLAFGFRTTMMRIGTTMLEVVSPTREKHQLQDFFVERGGDGGFMVVMQTYDDDALLARAAAEGHKLAFEIPSFQGQHLMQFDYKTFGTRFEFYKYTPEDNWWGNPLGRPYKDAKVSRTSGPPRSRSRTPAQLRRPQRRPSWACARTTACTSSTAASISWSPWARRGGLQRFTCGRVIARVRARP